MRAVHLSCHRDPLRRGAAELLPLWDALTAMPAAAADAGVEVEVVQAAWRDETVEHRGVRCHFVAEPLPAAPWARRLPRRLIARALSLNPDVIHFQGLGFALPTALLTRGTRVPVLAQDHSNTVPRTAPRRAVMRFGLARVAGVAFTAREQAEPFREAGILRPDVPVFEVAESSSRFTPGDAAAARARTGIGGSPCLLWIGRLDANKDPLLVLDAVSRVLDTLPDLRLWMCHHEAPLEGEVRARLAADPRLAGRVTLLGRVPHGEIEHLCRAADFLVAASRREGAMYALLEALACGAAPLVTDIPTLRKMTGGGAVGGLFPPGSAEALARLIVAQAPRAGEEMRREVRAHFDRHLSFAVLGREMRDAYERLAAEARR